MRGFKRTLKTLYVRLGLLLLTRCVLPLLYGPGITILCGHRVLPDSVICNGDDPRTLRDHMSASEFREAIRIVKKHYQILSLVEAVEQLEKGTLSHDSVVVTLDDGFVDNYQCMLPIIRDLHVPVTFYLSTAVIGSSDSLWFQAIIN